MDSLVLNSRQLTLSILLYVVISNADILLLSSTLSVQVSQPYSATGHTSDPMSLSLMMMAIQINELELELELEDQFRYSCLFRSHTSCIIKGTWVRGGRLVIALNCQLAGRRLKSRYMLQIRTSSKNHNSLVTTFINSCHLFVPTSTLCMSYGPKQRNNNDHSFVI